jgi:hypothetical protein
MTTFQSNGVMHFWFDLVLARPTSTMRIPQPSATKHTWTQKVMLNYFKRSTNVRELHSGNGSIDGIIAFWTR